MLILRKYQFRWSISELQLAYLAGLQVLCELHYIHRYTLLHTSTVAADSLLCKVGEIDYEWKGKISCYNNTDT